MDSGRSLRPTLRSLAVSLASALVVALGTPGTAGAQTPCLDPGTRSGFVASRTGSDPFALLVPRARVGNPYTEKVRRVVRDLFPGLRRAYGPPLPRFDGRPGPYEIAIVAPESIPGINGTVMEWCGRRATSVTVVAAGLDQQRLGSVVAHELLHVFQAASGGAPVPGGWWIEATATWFQDLERSDPDTLVQRDRLFLSAPEVPLDTFDFGGEALKVSHPYGVFRFVQWLARDRGWTDAQTHRFLRGTFAAIALGTDQTVAVREALRGAGIGELGEVLGRFWGSRLGPDGPGPRTEGRVEPLSAGPVGRDLGAGVVPLGASVLRLRPAAGLRQVSVRLDPSADPSAQVWVLSEGVTARRVLPGDEETLCIGGPPLSGGSPLVGDLAIATTNAGSAALGAVPLTVDATDAPCEALPSLPAAGCPLPFPQRRIPAGFTRRLTYAQDITSISARWGFWYRLILTDEVPAEGDVATMVRLRRSALTYDCVANVLDTLRNVPAPMVSANARAAMRFRELAEQFDALLGDCRAAVALDARCPPVIRSTFSISGEGHAALQALVAAQDAATRRETSRCQALLWRRGRHPCAAPIPSPALNKPPF